MTIKSNVKTGEGILGWKSGMKGCFLFFALLVSCMCVANPAQNWLDADSKPWK
jgi:hypothetical protein